MRPIKLLISLSLCVASCGPSYSPDTYSSTAVQQANKVDQGVVVGVRGVGVSAAGAVGTATGAAAGGIAGSQVAGGTAGAAFGALGGAVIGGVVGSGIEHATGDTQAYEYVVRKSNGDLLSVTQRDAHPLAIGAKVLVIAGNQARIVPDYTVSLPEPAKPLPVQTAPAPPPVFDSPLPNLTPGASDKPPEAPAKPPDQAATPAI